MFSVVSVWEQGAHATFSHDAMDKSQVMWIPPPLALTVQGPLGPGHAHCSHHTCSILTSL